MNINSQNILTLAAILISAITGASAQTNDAGKNEISVWGGGSFDSTTGIIGSTPDTRFATVSVRYAHRFNNNDRINLRYTADFTPAAVLSFPYFRAVQTGANTFRVDSVHRSVYAFGVAPLGLQMNFRPRKKVQPFVGASGGFLYFARPIPDFTGTRFNFTADLGGGVDIRTRKNRAVQIGYKYMHISNGYRGVSNPGYDNNVFYVGYTFFSK